MGGPRHRFVFLLRVREYGVSVYFLRDNSEICCFQVGVDLAQLFSGSAHRQTSLLLTGIGKLLAQLVLNGRLAMFINPLLPIDTTHQVFRRSSQETGGRLVFMLFCKQAESFGGSIPIVEYLVSLCD